MFKLAEESGHGIWNASVPGQLSSGVAESMQSTSETVPIGVIVLMTNKKVCELDLFVSGSILFISLICF